MDELDWRRFVAAYHQAHPGITEQLFLLADTSPYAWLAEVLHGTSGTLLDLACGSAPTRDELTDADWVGIDSSAAELAVAARRGRGPLVRAGADRLPAATGSVGAVCAAMCLPVVTPLPRVLREVRRVLRPGGTLAALVPSRSGLSASGLVGWLRVMAALRAVRQPWPNPRARDGLAALLGTAGFRVRHNERRVFTLAIDSADAAALLVDALYLPGMTHHRAQAAKRSLARWAVPGRRLELPLRRVVADLPAHPPSTEPMNRPPAQG
ncbi:Methyltransferase domain-containing protein [Streptomyces sp. DvalAA-14]|uniref:class I SAM-dependent methyltransferase n=1 Tax=unclassified Streptomyces TaxID=2593676 RepID=UPI00081B5C55|nr:MULTISPECIES: class I SAM-dependent methyltransferase [unclassified Streptomyces]SCE38798.1 Methyltransferase domain-containing protein [Streptomyces sp. DvalAA-14]